MEQQNLTVVSTEVVDGTDVQVMPHGFASRYNSQELDQVMKVRKMTEAFQQARSDLGWELVLTKRLLDGEDAADGRLSGAGREKSRFWAAVENGDLGEYWQAKARSSIKDTLQAGQIAGELASFIGRPPANKNLFTAVGLSQKVLLVFDRLADQPKELARLTYQHHGVLSLHFMEALSKVCLKYPDLTDTVREGIMDRSYKIPSDLINLMDRYQRKLDQDKAAEKERRRLELEAAARTAAEAQAEADRKLQEEIEAELGDEPDDAPEPEQGTPPAPPADEPKVLTTYPVQEVIDGTAFEGLQKRYNQDTADFFTDMRELYAAVRRVDEITHRWSVRLQDQHLSGHKNEMLLWETYSVAWNRQGKFKKLGGNKVTSVPDFWAMIGDLAQRVKGATARCLTYSRLDTKKYGTFKVAETSDEHYQPGRVDA